MIRILIVEEFGLFRAGLRVLLNNVPEFEVVGEASNREQMQQLSLSANPDVLLVSLGVQEVDIAAEIKWLKQVLPQVRVVSLTHKENHNHLNGLLKVGVLGFVLMCSGEEELIHAVRTAAENNLYIHPGLLKYFGTAQSREPDSSGPPVALTPREKDVLRLIVHGYTNRQIAAALEIGVRTVETHRARLIEKLGLRSRADLVRFALRNRIFLDSEMPLPK